VEPRIRGTLQEAGLVDLVGLSYAASFASLPDQLVYCEHGNQFDPASIITDYANRLDTPVGTHVLAEMVRPIGSGAAAIGGVDLREVRYVFPLAAHPGPAEWIAGRIFYQFLGQVLRWLLAPLIVAYAAYEALVAVVRPVGGSLGLRPLFLELAYILGLLVVTFAVLFQHQSPDGRQCSVRDALALSGAGAWPGALPRGRGRPPAPGGGSAATHGRDRRPPRAGGVRFRSHPRPGELDARPCRRAGDGDRQHRLLAPQLQPVDALLGAPPVFVVTFVHSHARVRAGQDGLTVELWDQPRPAGRRLPWIERAAIAGRLPHQPPPDAGPRLLARQVVAPRRVPGPS
jgi:hypothetical protein